MKIDMERLLASAPAYYHRYILECGSSDLLWLMEDQIAAVKSLFGIIFYDKRHLVDAERIFMYRALRFARNDKTELPGFEENDYIPATNFDARGIESLLEEFEYQRLSSIVFLKSLTEEEKWRTGTANGNSISVNALFFATAGHYNHHMKMIRERYR